MKIIRYVIATIAVLLVIIPINIIVTLASDVKTYRRYRESIEIKAFERLIHWAGGK